MTAPRALGIALGLLYSFSQCAAATVPFTEDFTASVANWADHSGTNLLTYVASGGPDGTSYASTEFSLFNLGGEDVVLLRAHDEFNSSGHAFEGNWVAQNIGQFSTYVRHNAPMPLNFFTRFSGPGNFPGAVAVKFIPVLPNTWTVVGFDIDPGNPEFVTYEGTSFNAVFSNVGHIQVGVRVPAALAAMNSTLTFDIDKPTIVPEPASAAIGLLAVAALLSWRRRRCDRVLNFSR